MSSTLSKDDNVLVVSGSMNSDNGVGQLSRKQRSKYNNSSITRERNIEAITSTTTTLAWLHQSKQQRAAKDENKKEKVAPASNVSSPSAHHLHHHQPRRRPIKRKSSSGTIAEERTISMLLCFCFTFFTCLVIIQLVFVDVMMDHDSTTNDHYSIQHVLQRVRQRNSNNNITTTNTNNNQTNNNSNNNNKYFTDAISIINTGLLPMDQLLIENGVSLDTIDLQTLPSVEDIDILYGQQALVYGLKDACPAFRASVMEEDRLMAPAGMFNTRNCCLKARQTKYGEKACGARFQVPWGKHSPVSFRLKHSSELDNIMHKNALPIVVIKDPYTWMSSMCRHAYSAFWKRDETHCPNLVVSNNTNESLSSIPVTVVYPKDAPIKETHYKSLIHLWNSYYEDYLAKANDFPLLVIRFEDLLFHTKDIVTQVCNCVGGVMEHDTFRYVTDSAKKGVVHQGSSGLAKAISTYGNATKRREPYYANDLNYIEKEVSQDLMHIFQYKTIQ